MTAGEIMTRFLVTVLPTATIEEVARTLAEHAISGVPVCEADGALVGIISEGDLIRPLARGAHRLGRQTLAHELMWHSVVTGTEATDVADIVELMMENDIKRVPILHDGKLVGIVTRADLVKTMAHRPDALLSTD